jgi:uncharacterized protein
MLIRFGLEVWTLLTELAPYLFLGAGIATLLKFGLPQGFITSQMGRPTLGSVVKSVFLGVPMPLCSCGVIPAAIGLKKSGASNGAVVGFMISTPQTGADSLLISASFLGWPLALFMLAVTFVSGLVGGLLVHWLAPFDQGREKAPDFQDQATCAISAAPTGPRWQRWFRYATEELIGGVYRYLILGILVSAVISLAVPPNYFSAFPALRGILGMLAVLLIAVPMYVCSNGSVPIVASLIQAGLPVGSALVFLMAGPATNVATIGAVLRSLGIRVMAIYLGTILVMSVLAGLLFQTLWGTLTLQHVALHQHTGGMGLVWILSALSAVFLVVLLLKWSYLDVRNWLRGRTSTGSEELVLQVDGMTCANCAAHIKRDLLAVPGVGRVEVNLETGWVRMWGQGLNRERLSLAVCSAGYSVRGYTCP